MRNTTLLCILVFQSEQEFGCSGSWTGREVAKLNGHVESAHLVEADHVTLSVHINSRQPM